MLDAHAILHRAYHALPEFTSPAGEPTGVRAGRGIGGDHPPPPHVHPLMALKSTIAKATLAVSDLDRGYYGTVNHDSKAVYQRYMGWYSGNPAELYPLPPVDAAKKSGTTVYSVGIGGVAGISWLSVETVTGCIRKLLIH